MTKEIKYQCVHQETGLCETCFKYETTVAAQSSRIERLNKPCEKCGEAFEDEDSRTCIECVNHRDSELYFLHAKVNMLEGALRKISEKFGALTDKDYKEMQQGFYGPKIDIGWAKSVADAALSPERGEEPKWEVPESIESDEVTVAFFQKYLAMPNGNLEQLCRKAEAIMRVIDAARNLIYTDERHVSAQPLIDALEALDSLPERGGGAV